MIYQRTRPGAPHPVRAQESRIRQKSAWWHSPVSKNTCRPIIDWTAEEVFAYLHRENLPVHPAYAKTYAGQLDRRWLRVHLLCSYHAAHHGTVPAH